MLKLEMKLDIERIEQAQKYTPQAIQSSVDNAFGKYGFRKETQSDGTICYYGTGAAKDYGIFGRLITTLKDKDWFMPYVAKWLWYNSDDGEDENDFAVEDILLHYAGREMSDTFPWLQHCVNHFEVTNVGANHDLMDLFAEEIEEPIALP